LRDGTWVGRSSVQRGECGQKAVPNPKPCVPRRLGASVYGAKAERLKRNSCLTKKGALIMMLPAKSETRVGENVQWKKAVHGFRKQQGQVQGRNADMFNGIVSIPGKNTAKKIIRSSDKGGRSVWRGKRNRGGRRLKKSVRQINHAVMRCVESKWNSTIKAGEMFVPRRAGEFCKNWERKSGI